MEGLRGQDPRVRGATDGHDPGVEPEAHNEQTYQGGGQASNGRGADAEGLALWQWQFYMADLRLVKSRLS